MVRQCLQKQPRPSFIRRALPLSGLTPLDPRNGYRYGRASVQPLRIIKKSLRGKLRRILPLV